MLSPLATVVYNHFEEMADPRLNGELNHDLGELMFIALTAALANADSWADVERLGDSSRGRGATSPGWAGVSVWGTR